MLDSCLVWIYANLNGKNGILCKSLDFIPKCENSSEGQMRRLTSRFSDFSHFLNIS